MQYVWLIWSLIILSLWAIIYLSHTDVRKEMVKMSWITMPLGLTEPLFVPKYWIPPSLFDLAENTGFDIGSLIFSFAIGGIGTVLCNLIFKRTNKIFLETNCPRGRNHGGIWPVSFWPLCQKPIFCILPHPELPKRPVLTSPWER